MAGLRKGGEEGKREVRINVVNVGKVSPGSRKFTRFTVGLRTGSRAA